MADGSLERSIVPEATKKTAKQKSDA